MDKTVQPLDFDTLLEECTDPRPYNAPSQLVIDRGHYLKRIEHRFAFMIPTQKEKETGIKDLVNNPSKFKFLGHGDEEPTPDPGSIWAQNMSRYNTGSLSPIDDPFFEPPLEENLGKRSWDEFNVASSLLHFNAAPQNDDNELVPIKSTARMPENFMCFSINNSYRKRSTTTPNTFIVARKSIHPLLCEMQFNLISPLISTLWSDHQSAALYDYYHLLGWYNYLQTPAASTYNLRDARDRSDKANTKHIFQGKALILLQAIILKAFDKPYDAGLSDLLQQITDDLYKHANFDTAKAGLLKYLGFEGDRGENQSSDSMAV